MPSTNCALYYPSIEFEDYSRLWSAALLWDRVYRIVPDGYEPNDPPNVRRLAEAGEIGIPIRPGPYAREVAGEFVAGLESRRWDAAALVLDVPSEYARIHQDKIDVDLRRALLTGGAAKAQGEWLCVPTEFESLYMTLLADRMARANDLQLLSDRRAAWSGSTYFHYDGRLDPIPDPAQAQQLAALVIRDCLPERLCDIEVEDLLSFRARYRGICNV